MNQDNAVRESVGCGNVCSGGKEDRSAFSREPRATSYELLSGPSLAGVGVRCYTEGRRFEGCGARPGPSPISGRRFSKRQPAGALGSPAGIALPRPDSSVVERGPEKAGVGGSIPSLATTSFNNLAATRVRLRWKAGNSKASGNLLTAPTKSPQPSRPRATNSGGR